MDKNIERNTYASLKTMRKDYYNQQQVKSNNTVAGNVETKNVLCKKMYDIDCLVPICPNCLEVLTDRIDIGYQKYCMNCGQKLDWTNFVKESIDDTNLKMYYKTLNEQN
jgi:hypothetical protein